MPCDDPDCVRTSGNSMGHSLCADHCDCLRDDFTYDPLRCSHCCAFVRGRFQGVTERKSLKSASAELERHILKLRRYCSGLDTRVTLKFTKFVSNLRLECRHKSLDLDFLRDLAVGESATHDIMSEPKSSLASRPSSGGI